MKFMGKLKEINKKTFFLYSIPFTFFCLILAAAIYSSDLTTVVTEDSSLIKNQYKITVERQDTGHSVAMQPASQAAPSRINPASDYFSVTVRKGRSFSDALAEAGIDRYEAKKVSESVGQVINP